MKLKTTLLFLSFLFFSFGYGCSQSNTVANGELGKKSQKEPYYRAITGTLGTYATPPHLANMELDAKKLIAELKDIHANTYNWLIWRDDASDLDALKQFLPLAKKVGLKVWVTLVPPSEPPPSQPFGLDYNKWASELAKLSKKEPNLVAWSIDDFVHNLDFFSPEYVKEFVSLAHAINPKLMFVPCCYYRSITDSFVKKCRSAKNSTITAEGRMTRFPAFIFFNS